MGQACDSSLLPSLVASPRGKWLALDFVSFWIVKGSISFIILSVNRESLHSDGPFANHSPEF